MAVGEWVGEWIEQKRKRRTHVQGQQCVTAGAGEWRRGKAG